MRGRAGKGLLLGSAIVLCGVVPAWAGTTERASVGPDGRQGNGASSFPSVSADGRFAAFNSEAANLVQGDTNGVNDVFVRDRERGRTERVSLGPGGRQADGSSSFASISADGRFVAFISRASNLVSNDTNGELDVFVRDRKLGTTERVSLGPGGRQAKGGEEYRKHQHLGRWPLRRL